MSKHFSKDAKTSGMDIINLLQKRRSIRAFKTDPVSQQQLDVILAAGNHAPSGGNRHPWKYFVIQDVQTKKSIRESCEKGDREWHKSAEENLQKWLRAKNISPTKEFLTEAPTLIVVFGDSEDPYWLESCWISIGYMMLACVDQGLGTVIYTPGDPAGLSKILNVDKRFVPQVILPIGVPLVEPQVNPTKQTIMESQADSSEKQSKVAEPVASEAVYQIDEPVKQTEKPKSDLFGNSDKAKKDHKCACGCGKKIVGLNSKRKYIHGHAKFGPNGLHIVLKNPPRCKCGCGEVTEWNWEKMNWKKYIDKHIGIHKVAGKTPQYIKQQTDLFQ